MLLPNMPLAEIFDNRAGKRLSEAGATIHRRVRVMWIETGNDSQLSLVLPEGDARQFGAVVLAVPWHRAGNLFPPALLDELPALSAAQNLIPGAITAVHLRFDRPITHLPHAIFAGKISQWIFRDANRQPAIEQTSHAHGERGHGTQQPTDEPGFHYQVVISAAHRLAAMEKNVLLERVLNDLSAAFPDVKFARLLHSRVVVQPQAVFSMQPGVDERRPSQTTSLANLFLAGDWTDTGWPATMEGAVRSGYLAVESLLASLGRPQKILVPDLPRGFFASRIIS